jgi:hypothetical protein
MKVAHEPSTLIEKEKIRLRITLQTDDFLRSGGEISVVQSAGQSLRASFGCGWHSQDDFPQLTE